MTDGGAGAPEPRAVGPALGQGVSAPAPPPAPPPAPFGLDAVKAAIAADLAMDPGVPDGHRGAVSFVLNNGVLQAATAVRVLDRGALRWDVGAVVSHSAVGGTGFGVIGKITF